MSFKNVGIATIKDVNTHILLQQTEIVWLVLFAWIIQRERPDLPTAMAIIVVITATILILFDFIQRVSPNYQIISINTCCTLHQFFNQVMG